MHVFYISECGEYKSDNVLELMGKDCIPVSSSEDHKEELGSLEESHWPLDRAPKIKRLHSRWALFKKIMYVCKWRKGGRKGEEKRRKTVSTSLLVPHASQEESQLLSRAGSAFDSLFSFLAVKRDFGHVIVVYLMALYLPPPFPDQVCLLSYKEPQLISAPALSCYYLLSSTP